MRPELTDRIVDAALEQTGHLDGGPAAGLDANQGTDPRYEIKLPLRNRTPAGLWSSIRRHPMAFEPLYPDRRINNVYFDTSELTSFYASHAGLDRRLKVRLRWYGDSDDVETGHLEWKWRQGMTGFKWRREVHWEGGLAKRSWRQLRQALRADLDGAQRATFDALAFPTLLNRYRRSYFISRDGSCRLTWDRELLYIAQMRGKAPRTRAAVPHRRMDVLEIKLPASHSDDVRRVLAGFPYRPARFSKYTTGLESFLGVIG